MQIIIIKNPLEQFEILDLFSISTSLLGYRFVLTNLGLYIIIITVLSCCISIWITSKSNKLLLHSYGSILSESIYATILGMVKNQIGASNEKYLPIIFTLFIFILFNNLIGMVPYSFTPTSHLELSLILFITPILRNYSNNSTVDNNNISSVKCYENADTMKLNILKENANKAGIYRWTTTTRGGGDGKTKIYIGRFGLYI